jgi:hypothetical protein
MFTLDLSPSKITSASTCAAPWTAAALLPLSPASPAGVEGGEMSFGAQRLRPRGSGSFSWLPAEDSDGSRLPLESGSRAAAVQGAAHFRPSCPAIRHDSPGSVAHGDLHAERRMERDLPSWGCQLCRTRNNNRKNVRAESRGAGGLALESESKPGAVHRHPR